MPRASSVVLFGLRHTGAGNGFFTGEIEEARLYDRALTAEQVQASFQTGVASITLQQITKAFTKDERLRWVDLQLENNRFRQARSAIPDVPLAYAANSRQPEATAILTRGEADRPGEIVSAGGLSAVRTPEAELGLKPDALGAERRRRFADWLTNPANPLTARVMVNRLWHYHFGRGLVDTPNEFGVNGGRPIAPRVARLAGE